MLASLLLKKKTKNRKRHGINMETNMSLDDIIQQKFPRSANARGKRGAARGRRGQSAKPILSGGRPMQTNQKNKMKMVVKTRGLQSRRGGARPRPSGQSEGAVGDARSRIIQQKRLKINDAREKLGEIAKMSDARLKLNKLHGHELGGRSNVPSKPKALRMTGGITVQTGRNGQIQLTTNKNKGNQQQRNPFREPAHALQTGRVRVLNTIPNLLDIDLDLEDDPPPLGLIRRTVNNRPTVLSHHMPPSFSPSRQREREAYTWTKPSSDDMEFEDSYERMSRDTVTVRPQILRNSILQPAVGIRRPPSNTMRILARNTSPQPASDWYHREPAVKRTTNNPRPTTREDAIYSDDEDPIWSRSGNRGVKSRLDAHVSAPHSMGILAAESKSLVGNSQATSRIPPSYHRIVVSNLQKSVTNEDIRELFEDIGSLVQSKLVRPGTAEVVYRSRKDAVKAVDIYHNRQLDGEPMKCMLVNSRPLPTVAQPSASRNARPTSSNAHFRGAVSTKFQTSKKSTVFPDMDTIHKALFKRS